MIKIHSVKRTLNFVDICLLIFLAIFIGHVRYSSGN